MVDDIQLSQEMGGALDRQDAAGVKALLDAGADPKGVWRGGAIEISFLRKAMQIGNLDCVRILLERGADVHERNNMSLEPPIVFAARLANAPLCELLAGHGANVNDRDGYGHTALTSVGQSVTSPTNRESALATTSTLLALGADAAAKSHFGLTALHRAADNESAESAMLLIDHGCPVNVRDKNGETALQRAIKLDPSRNVHRNLCAVMIAAGVPVEQMPTPSDWHAYTPLLAASSLGWTSRCLSLLEKGEPEGLGNDDQSASARAEQCGHSETAAAIRDWLARKQITDIQAISSSAPGAH